MYVCVGVGRKKGRNNYILRKARMQMFSMASYGLMLTKSWRHRLDICFVIKDSFTPQIVGKNIMKDFAVRVRGVKFTTFGV